MTGEAELAILNGIDDVIYVADPDTHELVYCNPACERLFGTDAVGKKCHEVLQNRPAPCPFCTNELIFGPNLGHVHVWEFRNERTRRWFRCSDRAIRWPDGRWVRLEAAADITASAHGAEALQESEARFRHVIESSSDVLYRRNLVNDTYDYISPSCERVFGYTSEEMRRMSLEVAKGHIHPDSLAAVTRAVTEVVSEAGVSTCVEYRFRHKDGEFRCVSDAFTVSRDALGRPRHLIGNARDITAHRRAEEELRQSEARHRALLAAIPDLIFVIDAGGFLRDYQAAADAKLYAPPGEFIGRHLRVVLPEPVADLAAGKIASIVATGKPAVFEYGLEMPEGPRTYEARLSAYGHDAFLALVRDISERRRAERTEPGARPVQPLS
jgi:PAS domain S-box-containing protein